ncbi:MAG: phosphoribosylformylglycinamidine synthase I [Candidatus Daviesbacteria bacterium]|nr:phosphoribosylformylglycinamidine synthase I [Candidatus Daviesbacteria bacterium]
MGKSKRVLKVGIIRFPCSNCDFDALHFFQKFGHSAEFIWYKETKLKDFDLLVLPGGFAFGDRVYKKATEKFIIDPGTQALTSPVMRVIKEFAQKGTPILGICNGFQILVKSGLLPGKLLQNKSKKFFCDWVVCKVVGKSVFGDKSLLNKFLKLPVAHGYGRYEVSKKKYEELKNNGQIFVEYSDINPNGSFKNIAGVSNLSGTIFGLMPHPERSPDGKFFMRAIEKYVNK